MHFYTNVYVNKNKILIRGVKDGRPYKKVVSYSPYLFVPSKTGNTKFRTVFGKPVDKMQFDSIYDAKDFSRTYENTAGFEISGSTNYLYTYIYDTFRGDIKYDPSLISSVSLDIETKIGKEDIATAIETTPNEITAISISRNGKKTTFGLKPFESDREDVKYYHCASEVDLLKSFITVLNSVEYSPDVLTGWNIEFFDIPYLVRRILKVLGEEYVKQLSPWGMIRPYEVEIKGRKITSYELQGISILDYLALYKKFTYTQQETYKLDYIAQVELDERKVDYKTLGYTDLNDLWERNHQLFIEYNIQDVDIIDKLEAKMKLIELVYTMAYMAKVNYTDTLGSVKIWEVYIHNFLMDRNLIVTKTKSTNLSTDFAGGYVKEVQTGMHKWVVSFDLDSLYPHLIMQYNISPEMFVERLQRFHSVDNLLKRQLNLENEGHSLDFSYAANGCIYTRSKQGFLAEIMEKLYAGRSAYKKQMIEVKKEYEKTKESELLKEVSRLNNLQMALKIFLNSAYGALGNRYFAWFDVNHAEAITLSGQLSIRWVSDDVNDYLNKLCGTTNVDYIVANDTDSLYVCLDTLVSKFFEDQSDKEKIVNWLDKFCGSKLQDIINKSFDKLAVYMNAYQQKMRMKRETIADKAIWTAKKRYVMNAWDVEGVRFKEPKLKMTGIEAIKSSTPSSCRNAIKEALNIIMNKDEKSLQTYVADFRDNFKQLPFYEIAAPRGVSNVDEYVVKNSSTLFKMGTPINAKGAILYNHLIKRLGLEDKYELIGNGDKIRYCYLRAPNPHGVNVIACPGDMPKEFKLERYLNYDLQFEKSFLSPMEIILNAIGWNYEQRATLESFFD